MSNDDEVYAYENEDDFKLEPDLLRELPELTGKDLDKIANFET